MRYPLPYAFARSHKLLLDVHGDAPMLWWCAHSDRQALSEVLRKHALLPLQWACTDEDDLVQRIGQAYAGPAAGASGTAAAVVSEVESAADLSRMMQELPAVEDLLEAHGDAIPASLRR